MDLQEKKDERQHQEAEEEESEEDSVNAINLKRRISGHSLYEAMSDWYTITLEFLKAVGFHCEFADLERNDSQEVKQALGVPTQQKELDQFMEAYCLALGKLKEAMEEPYQISMAFITNMHLQLEEQACFSHPHEPADALLVRDENDDPCA